MIDNFELMKTHLGFNSKDEFYFVQIIQRKKDGNNELHISSGYRRIRSYYIYSVEELEELRPRIIELCTSNNARAYINPNIRNAKEVSLKCIQKYSELIYNDNSFQGNNVWDSCCGSTKAKGYKAKWIVDVDDPNLLNVILGTIKNCRHNPEFECFVVPTVHGFHIVCNGFDVNQFNSLLKDKGIDKVDIHKDNPTLLYYNDLSSKQE